MYNFKRLIKKYGKISLSKRIEIYGGYDYDQGGIWVEGNVGAEFFGTFEYVGNSLGFDLDTGYADSEAVSGGTLSGLWVEFEGAVTPIDEKLIKDSLDYTVDDKTLHTYEPLESGQVVRHKGIEYTLMSFKDYSDFDQNLKIFIMKRGGQ